MAAQLNKTVCKDQLKWFPLLTNEQKQAVERLNNLLKNQSVLALSLVIGH